MEYRQTFFLLSIHADLQPQPSIYFILVRGGALRYFNISVSKKVSIPYRKQSYLICRGNQMAGYNMKCKAGVK